MFTGLVEDVGTVEVADRSADALILGIATAKLPAGELSLGESVAVDGVCLTVTDAGPGRFRVLAGAETLRRTTLGGVAVGRRVNLERALRLGDRLGGHMVAGHVDGVATLAGRNDAGANLELDFEAAPELVRYVIEKGSVCVDGISLTVNRVSDVRFGVALIPHTVSETALGDKAVGDSVNLEVDMIAKYVERLLGGHRP